MATFGRTSRLLLTAILCSLAASAQTNTASNQSQPQEGWEGGGYVMHQSLEIGYRGSDVTGRQSVSYMLWLPVTSEPR